MTLQVTNLFSGYRQVPVLKDINFTIKFGEIVGLIGLNGAGKSTLLKTILGLIEPLQGSVTINNLSIIDNHKDYAQNVAYIPETPILYEELTLKEHIEMTALGYNIPVDVALKRAEPLLKMFRLDKNLNWFPTHFSKGMKQKVMVICAMITDAKIMIIDEPFLGLDPIAIRDLTNLIQERAASGTAILFTTHVLSIADELCDYYLMLRSGLLIGQGDLVALREHFNMPEATIDEIYIEMTEQEEAR